MSDLNKINKELKSYVNQANFISQKTRNKLIKMLGEEFQIDLPIENFANIDVQLTSDGSIIMRGDIYNAPVKLSNTEIENKYALFKEKAEKLINKKEVNYQNKNDLGNIANIFIVIILSIAYIVVGILLIRAVFALPLFTASILASLLSSYLVPGIRNRFEQARNFLKRKFKKRK